MVNIGKYREEYLLQRAEEIVVAKTNGSRVMNTDAEAAVPRFDPQGEFVLKVPYVEIHFYFDYVTMCRGGKGPYYNISQHHSRFIYLHKNI
jgi:hypothetical protein